MNLTQVIHKYVYANYNLHKFTILIHNTKLILDIMERTKRANTQEEQQQRQANSPNRKSKFLCTPPVDCIGVNQTPTLPTEEQVGSLTCIVFHL